MTNPWGLTVNEQQVIDLMTLGRHSKDIAAELGIGIKTVEDRRSNAINKMGCRGNSLRAAVLWDRFAMGRDETEDAGLMASNDNSRRQA